MENLKDELCLKPGTVVFHDSNGYGLRSGAQIRYARDEQQTLILKAMEQNQFVLKALIDAVNNSGPGKLQEGIAAVAVAEFILNFEAYLRNGKKE